jgi:uncharacterized protein YcbX
MHVEALWRYPVKSLRGEPLQRAQLTTAGVAGDRIVHVANPHAPLTGRSKNGLLTIPAITGPDGIPQIDGHPWDGAAALAAVRERAGAAAQLTAYEGPERFDVLNLLVATDGAVEAFGHDVRRLRPNILLGGVDADEEATWAGHALRIGNALIGVHSLRDRCVVTTVDPDSGDRDPDVLRRINRDFGGKLALNCWVIEPGRIGVGDEARLEVSDAIPLALGGWVVGRPYVLSSG